MTNVIPTFGSDITIVEIEKISWYNCHDASLVTGLKTRVERLFKCLWVDCISLPK